MQLAQYSRRKISKRYFQEMDSINNYQGIEEFSQLSRDCYLKFII